MYRHISVGYIPRRGMVIDYTYIQFCSIFKCSVNWGDYLISMSLKKMLWKGKMLTCFESLLCARHSAGCFPVTCQGRGCCGHLSVSFLCHCSQISSKVRTASFLVSRWTLISTVRQWTMPFLYLLSQTLSSSHFSGHSDLSSLLSLAPFIFLLCLFSLFIHYGSIIFSTTGSKMFRLQSDF